MSDHKKTFHPSHVKHKRVALAVRLGGTHVPNWESRLSKSLLDSRLQLDFRARIEKELRNQMKEQGLLWPSPPTLQYAKSLARGVADSWRNRLLAMPVGQDLVARHKSLVDELDRTRPGFWVTDDRQFLYICGDLLTIGGVGGYALFGSHCFREDFLLNLSPAKGAVAMPFGFLNVAEIYHDANKQINGVEIQKTARVRGFEGSGRLGFTITKGKLSMIEAGLEGKLALPLALEMKLGLSYEGVKKATGVNWELSKRIGDDWTVKGGASFDSFDLKAFHLDVGIDDKEKLNVGVGVKITPKAGNLPSTFEVQLKGAF